MEAISVLMGVISSFIEEIEVLVPTVDASVVLMIEVPVGSIVVPSDTDASVLMMVEVLPVASIVVVCGDVRSVKVVMLSSVDSIVVIVCDMLIMGVMFSVVVDVVTALTNRERRHGNINSRYAILYLPKGIIEILFAACEHIYIYLYLIEIGKVLFSEIMKELPYSSLVKYFIFNKLTTEPFLHHSLAITMIKNEYTSAFTLYVHFLNLLVNSKRLSGCIALFKKFTWTLNHSRRNCVYHDFQGNFKVLSSSISH